MGLSWVFMGDQGQAGWGTRVAGSVGDEAEGAGPGQGGPPRPQSGVEVLVCV